MQPQAHLNPSNSSRKGNEALQNLALKNEKTQHRCSIWKAWLSITPTGSGKMSCNFDPNFELAANITYGMFEILRDVCDTTCTLPHGQIVHAMALTS
jgi:hypothetical protein